MVWFSSVLWYSWTLFNRKILSWKYPALIYLCKVLLLTFLAQGDVVAEDEVVGEIETDKVTKLCIPWSIWYLAPILPASEM